MSKKFDLLGSPKIGFIKKLRINPLFPFWKKEINVFLFFLFFIFFSTIFFSGYIKSYDFIQKIKQLSIFTLFDEKINIQNIDDLQKSIQILKKNILSVTEMTKNTLPSEQYSYSQKNIDILNKTLVDLEKIETAFPELKNSIQNITSKGSFELMLNYLHDNEKSLIELSEVFQYFINEMEVNIFLKKYLQPYKQNIINIEPFISNISENIFTFYEIFGDTNPHNIVVLFQNSNEKRATGGFIGSFIQIVFNDGKINKWQFHDIYDYDGQITENIKPPKLVEKLSGKSSWSLRDANYHPIFSKSAKAFMYLFEKSGGDTIDTIIAIDNTLIERLLSVIGPIEIPELNITLNKNNFSFILTYITESKIYINSPKSFIQQYIIPNLLNKIKSFPYEKIISFFILQKNNIQAYSRLERIQTLLDTMQIGKCISNILKDDKSIYINQISISGNKSDAFINQKISYSIKKNQKRFNINFKRTHKWSTNQEQDFLELFNKLPKPNIPNDVLKTIVGQGSNHSLYQIFLPEDAKNFEISPEDIKFNSWEEDNKMIVEIDAPLLKAGESQEFEFSFQHPSINDLHLNSCSSL